MKRKTEHFPFRTNCPACGKECRKFFLADDVEKMRLRSLECEWCGHDTEKGPEQQRLVTWRRFSIC